MDSQKKIDAYELMGKTTDIARTKPDVGKASALRGEEQISKREQGGKGERGNRDGRGVIQSTKTVRPHDGMLVFFWKNTHSQNKSGKSSVEDFECEDKNIRNLRRVPIFPFSFSIFPFFFSPLFLNAF